ncbi:hypothetical protein MTR67_039231 [Solanum verrucosum]|uniref:Uncharacterized protein n=1 Tax=Solanum verrucosum TaxID=315347 RepID=A0AAF0UHP1_SOLVR|nr:hypothetical protein MTR67_039231 [Solanum verrucosum]
MSTNTCKKMEHSLVEVMMFRDKILTFKQSEGEQLHEAWQRYKALLGQCPTHGVPDTVILESSYQGLNLENKMISDQHASGNLLRQSYGTTTKLIDRLTELGQEKTRRDFHLVTLLTQLDKLTKKTEDLGAQRHEEGRYIPLHKRMKIKNSEDGQVKEMLALLLQKSKEHHTILEELKENVLVINQKTTTHAMFIQVLESQMTQVLIELRQGSKEGFPGDMEENPTSRV